MEACGKTIAAHVLCQSRTQGWWNCQNRSWNVANYLGCITSQYVKPSWYSSVGVVVHSSGPEGSNTSDYFPFRSAVQEKQKGKGMIGGS